MSTINSTSNSYNLYTQNNAQVSNSQGQSRVHHHHKKTQSQDTSQISQEGLQALSSSTQGASSTAPKSPLDSLIANGTITQDQENSIKSAFQSARQANLSGAYGSKPTNPISSLVANGTITQDQANAIKSSFQSIAQANQGTEQVSDSQGQTRVHHHHHHVQQVQGAKESSQTTSQATDSSTESSSSSL
jgi:hypothetical protein